MIRQRQRHAVAQRRRGQLLAGVEQNAAVAAIAQFRIELAEGIDQIGLAVEINSILAGFRLSAYQLLAQPIARTDGRKRLVAASASAQSCARLTASSCVHQIVLSCWRWTSLRSCACALQPPSWPSAIALRRAGWQRPCHR